MTSYSWGNPWSDEVGSSRSHNRQVSDSRGWIQPGHLGPDLETCNPFTRACEALISGQVHSEDQRGSPAAAIIVGLSSWSLPHHLSPQSAQAGHCVSCPMGGFCLSHSCIMSEGHSIELNLGDLGDWGLGLCTFTSNWQALIPSNNPKVWCLSLTFFGCFWPSPWRAGDSWTQPRGPCPRRWCWTPLVSWSYWMRAHLSSTQGICSFLPSVVFVLACQFKKMPSGRSHHSSLQLCPCSRPISSFWSPCVCTRDLWLGA